ncbi:MAG: hypothetical protein GWN99_15970 [Gemmatimonadetes bacterium]|uniref:Uncharacterized protein n=1 Tax=Candidatus Kutchimonas denitrificans TaxID=3056748 RepID=A0AAE5CA79_9BACT|nr:hypothetical protein [Gemmatimonadota bacterium]NIR74282.1 hypothetical protein [Candidatus Kutchimonas denitrificans]NIS02537.1 hypothetical protein [Gemmatimonadota bacterium]NIT68413.1 hypothetical protein [Gemmatimonadota bacterium]NIU51865.1 hypothetical protein [Gemmatimonadota bacterium]
MDELIFFIILMIVAGILERIQRASQKKRMPPPGADGAEDEDGVAQAQVRGLGKDIQDLIAEELGINLERRPTVKAPPEAAAGKAAETEASPPARREVYMPGEPRRAPQRQRPRRQRPREPQPVHEPPRVVSLEEDVVRRPSEAVSLERPRRPEDHERFHDKYGVPEPVESHGEFHERYMMRRERPRASATGPRLPARPGWSAAAQAIVWAEVLGPPRGLRE